MKSNKKELLSKIDYAILKATTTAEEILKGADATREYGFATLCVFPKFIKVARTLLPQEKVCTVVGFPLSPSPLEVKLAELYRCCEDGAGEIDVVVDLGAVKSGDWESVERELKELREAAPDRVLKLIIECCYLSDEEKRTVCMLAAENGWDFVKTSTGYGTYGATPCDVELLSECTGGLLKVKAAGGIKSLEQVEKFLKAGADRIGTSSAIEIAKELLFSR
ncbi:deoxyribose-phosphate aldolase [Thermovibrio ammonificans]